MGRLDRGEIGIAVELARVERAHFAAASATVAGSRPFPLRRLAEARIPQLFLGRATGGFFGAEAGEIIPVAVVLGGMGFAEIPALAAVGRLGRGTVADVAAVLAVAQAHSRGVAAL